MGLPSQLAVLLLREHRYRPITGSFLSIGRQTVYLTPDEAFALVTRELGIGPRPSKDTLEIDVATRGARGQGFITDKAFYSLFSDMRFRCLDVSDYEGADIVFDLCGSLPAELEGQFDFILDGSSLDDIFDSAAAICNLARLLKPGGRIMHIDRASRRHNVYVAFALSWFHDYYAVNRFADCQVYLAQWEGDQPKARWDFYHYAPLRSQDGRTTYFGQDRWYYPWREALAVVIAEKDQASTWIKSPVQYEYRTNTEFEDIEGRREISHRTLPAETMDAYVSAAVKFCASRRPCLLKPEEKIEIPEKFRDYSPETIYCGSIFPVEEHLRRLRVDGPSATVADLPKLALGATGVAQWDGVDGLAIEEVATSSMIEAQPLLKLRVTTSDGKHRVGIAFRGLVAHCAYRVNAFVRVQWQGRLILDARDGTTAVGRSALFDINSSVVEGGISDGNLPAQDAWLRASIDVHSADGTLVVYVGLSDDASSMDFQGDGITILTFGGIEIASLENADLASAPRDQFLKKRNGPSLPIIFVHIGLPKTATTSIQSFFSGNPEILFKQRILYPATIARHDGHSISHRPLAAAIEPASVPWLSSMATEVSKADILGRLRGEIASTQAKKVLISSEDLAYIKNPAMLRKAFEPYPVRILICLRRQDSFLESFYNQIIKSRLYAASFDEFLQGKTGNPAESASYCPEIYVCDYRSLLDRWAAAFGKERTIPFVYEDFVESGGILHEVADKIGLDIAAAVMPKERLNARLPLSLLELKRQVNGRLRGDAARIAAEHFFAGRSAVAIKNMMPGTPERRANDLARRRAILGQYDTGNAQIAMEYFNGRSSLFPIPSEGDGLLPDGGDCPRQDDFARCVVSLIADRIQSSADDEA